MKYCFRVINELKLLKVKDERNGLRVKDLEVSRKVGISENLKLSGEPWDLGSDSM